MFIKESVALESSSFSFGSEQVSATGELSEIEINPNKLTKIANKRVFNIFELKV
jgi:hypothetical protein